jgi:hypothetical protein
MAVTAAVIWCAVGVTPADVQAPNATLPLRCSDQQVAPASVILACADAGSSPSS